MTNIHYPLDKKPVEKRQCMECGIFKHPHEFDRGEIACKQCCTPDCNRWFAGPKTRMGTWTKYNRRRGY